MLLKVDRLPNAVGKQPSIPLIYLGRKWTLNWWWAYLESNYQLNPHEAKEILQKLRSRISDATGEKWETSFLFFDIIFFIWLVQGYKKINNNNNLTFEHALQNTIMNSKVQAVSVQRTITTSSTYPEEQSRLKSTRHVMNNIGFTIIPKWQRMSVTSYQGHN